MDKKLARMRRTKRTRAKIKQLEVVRLNVHRTPKHMYAQLVATDGHVVAAASTLDKDVRNEIKHGGNINAAKLVGKLIASRGSKAGVQKVAFDRSGFKYHGRVKALAEAAREGGIDF